ncbi:MAG TPA: hypothetical protein DDW45_07295 [Gammaproteobacteria bacterium]|nr:hypothetical protein [Gammaproteobacteria bacterium]
MDLLLSIPGRFVPFFSWLPNLTNVTTLKADIIAGATVAMVLVPQSMAYASLAGLPAYYGLYASFLPPMVAALFGSSRQLGHRPRGDGIVDDGHRTGAPGNSESRWISFSMP